MRRIITWVVTLMVSSAAPLGAQESTTTPTAGRGRTAVAAQTAESPVIDGRLDEAAWTTASVLSDFVQREPVEGRPVSERTEVRILHDDRALYIGAWMYDRDPAGIVVGDTRRDASLNDTDAFLVIFDTYLDGQNGFVFGTTPKGVEYDGQVANEGQGGSGAVVARQQGGSGGGFNLNWDGSWEVATSIDADGWYAELRIPFSTLRYPKGGEQTWGVNFARNIRRRNEEAVWAPIPRQFNLYRVSLAGTLSVLRAPSQRILTVTPYVLGEAFRDYATQSSASLDAQVGGDAKIGLTQSLTLDLTVNTDFAQVEVDDQQVNLTRFPLFFPEKRAFFLENAGTFTVGASRSAELFFPRRIGLSGGREVPIQAGARLTGRLAGMRVGLLNIQANHLDLYDAELEQAVRVAPANNFGVIRLFREFQDRTRVGAIFVSRVNTDNARDHNLTYGLDGALGIGQSLTFDGWAARTSTPGVAAGEFAYGLGGRQQTRDWNVSASYREVGAQFNPEVGFLSRRAYRHLNTRIQRNYRFPGLTWFRELRPHVSWQEYWDLTGFSETRVVHIDSHFEFANGAFFQLPGVNFTGEGLTAPFEIRDGIVIPPGSYNHLDWEFRYNTNLSAPWSVRGSLDAGGFYTGTRYGAGATVTYRFRQQFVASVRLNYFDVRLAEGDFVTSVLALEGSYAFTPRVFLQASVQYNDESENLGSNVRFGWLNTAGTGLYVVYNDTEHLGSLDRTGIPAGPRQRQFVVKYTRQLDIAR